MSVRVLQPNGRRRGSQILLVSLFWVFSYTLLSAWGAVIAEDWSVVLSERRVAAVTLGAALYWFVLLRLQERTSVGIATVVGWMIAAMVTILLARLGLDQFSPDPVSPRHSVGWSLAWSGYFGIWLTGAVAFRSRPSLPVASSTESTSSESDDAERVYWDWIAGSAADRGN